jgi:23S rRNA (adenine2503-C2)-methyltransferase
VGCVFCATGQDGFRRNLTAGEIVGQALEVIRAERLLGDTCRLEQGRQAGKINNLVNNLVFMGMGEPFLNREMVMKAVDLFHAERGLNIGMRKMTISTCGVVPGILHLAATRSQMGLAVSLHSSFDAVRDILVPMNKKYPLAVLMGACREYNVRVGRRITFEMALTSDTCTSEEAAALTKLLKGVTAHVNLIPVNEAPRRARDGQVPSSACRLPAGSLGQSQRLMGCERPSGKDVSRFMRVLERARIPVSVREEKGADIEAACGQLRGRWGGEACEPII